MDKVAVLRRIDAMKQLLEDLRADVLTAEEAEGMEDVVEIPRQGTWSLRMVEDLYPHVEHRPGIMALLDLTATRSPHDVAYRDVLVRSGLTDREQRNDHARLSWISSRLLGKKTWPIECQQASDGEMRYRMPAKVAAWWHTVRGDA